MRNLIAVLVLAMVLSRPAGAFYQTRAVLFPYGTYLVTGNIPDNDLSPLGGSSSGLVCLWYNSDIPPAPGQAYTIVKTSTNNNKSPMFALELSSAFAGGATSAEFYLSDTRHWVHVISENIAPFGGWHYIGIAWDTSIISSNGTYAIKGVIDQIPAVWFQSANSKLPIYVNYRRADHWFVGSDEEDARPFDRYRGMLSQVYLHVGTTDYYSILDHNRTLPGCAMVDPSGRFGPMEYGPQCSGPFGVPKNMNEYLPILCLVGGIDTFQKNQGGSTSFAISPNGTRAPLQIALSDPFEVFK